MAKRRVYVRDNLGRFARTGKAVKVGGSVGKPTRQGRKTYKGAPYKQPKSMSPRGKSRIPGKTKNDRKNTLRSMNSGEIHRLLNTGSQTSNASKKRFQTIWPQLTPKQKSNYHKYSARQSTKALRRVWPGA